MVGKHDIIGMPDENLKAFVYRSKVKRMAKYATIILLVMNFKFIII